MCLAHIFNGCADLALFIDQSEHPSPFTIDHLCGVFKALLVETVSILIRIRKFLRSICSLDLQTTTPAQRLVDEMLSGWYLRPREHDAKNGGFEQLEPLWVEARQFAEHHLDEPVSKVVLGMCYYWTRGGVREDLEYSARMFGDAADHGLAHAQFMRAECLWYKYGVETHDSSRAAQLYELAARQGHAWAQYSAGTCCQDEASAVEWFRKAAAQGNEKAISRLKERNLM